MITGIFTIVGVILGFYLAKYSDINQAVSAKIKNIKQPKYGEPFVVRTDEVELEKQQKLAEENKPELINIKDIIKGL